LHYQASDSEGGATSNSKMSKVAYYRHVHYILALLCARNRVIIFCSLLDIRENVVALFYGPRCIFADLFISCTGEFTTLFHVNQSWLYFNEYLIFFCDLEEFCLCILQLIITGSFGVVAARKKRCPVCIISQIS